MSHWLHSAAETELRQAANYYAMEASRKVAEAFLIEFERVVAVLETHPKLGTVSKGGLRVHPLRRFPFSIVYRESEQGPRVYAVAHQRREPMYWQGRV